MGWSASVLKLVTIASDQRLATVFDARRNDRDVRHVSLLAKADRVRNSPEA
jgi:hypothetical protein